MHTAARIEVVTLSSLQTNMNKSIGSSIQLVGFGFDILIGYDVSPSWDDRASSNSLEKATSSVFYYINGKVIHKSQFILALNIQLLSINHTVTWLLSNWTPLEVRIKELHPYRC
ncbi:conserved hypothetical protein [Ricinus communis]|uniref:Uncharacterized protein n=1 Tax=Ricinus communis TaxID=3988 RepID=B9RML8_RICCO|nr:conserved hypothetical protein [Ricinus communis]